MPISPMQRTILDMIDEVRAEHNACTLGEIARKMRTHKATMKLRFDKLREAGLISWTRIPGSVVRVHVPEDLSDIPDVTAVPATDALAAALGDDTLPKPPRSPAQIAATQRMLAARAAKKAVSSPGAGSGELTTSGN